MMKREPREPKWQTTQWGDRKGVSRNGCMNGKAQAYRKEAFQNKYKEQHWSPVQEGRRKQMLSQENYCLLERDIQTLVCQELRGFYNRSIC